MVATKHIPSIYHIRVDRRDAQTVEVHWETDHPNGVVEIYLGDSPDNFDRTSPVSRVVGARSATISGLDADVRHYFEIVPEGGRGVVTAQRRVVLDGEMNFRDLGGYETSDGRSVKWGKIFRSGNLHRLTDHDMALLEQMDIRLICDLRTPTEVAKYPDRLPDNYSISYIHLPIAHSEFDATSAMDLVRKGDISWLTDEFMTDRYLRNIDGFAGTWGTVMEQLSESESRPLLFHCSAGKDRAGACAALILLFLGVPEETILYDHGLSNVFLIGWLEEMYDYIRSFDVDPERLSPYLTAPRDAMVALLEHIRDTYGSATEYLSETAGVDLKILEEVKRVLIE